MEIRVQDLRGMLLESPSVEGRERNKIRQIEKVGCYAVTIKSLITHIEP